MKRDAKKATGNDRVLLLMDGNSVLYRAFYGTPLLSTSKGIFTNAVYGMAQMVFKLMSDFRPTHLAVAFDKGKMTFRHDEYSEYKGKRQSTPDELIGQFSMAREMLAHFRIPTLEMERIEADDIIGTLSQKAGDQFDEVVLISGDKDLFQLVNERVIVYMTRKGATDLVRYDIEAVKERYEGLTPSQMIDLKGLMGDSSDNIPGVPGVGEKTAIKLLNQFASLEEVLAHIPEVSGNKLKERLTEHGELARMSKRLATIKTDVDNLLPIDDLKYSGYDMEELRKYFRELEFRALADRIKPWFGAAKEEALTQGGTLGQIQDGVQGQALGQALGQVSAELGEDGAEAEAGTQSATQADALTQGGTLGQAGAQGQGAGAADEVVSQSATQTDELTQGGTLAQSGTLMQSGLQGQATSGTANGVRGADGHSMTVLGEKPLAELPAWLDQVQGAVVMLMNLDGSYQDGHVLGIAFTSEQEAVYFPTDDVQNAADNVQDHVRKSLTKLIQNNDIEKISYDFKAQLVAGKRSGLFEKDMEAPRQGVLDTLIATYLVYASDGEPDLIEVVEKALPEAQVSEADRVSLEKGGAGKPLALLRIAQQLFEVREPLRESLAGYDLFSLYENVEWPLSEVLAEMELYGVRVDAGRLQEIGLELSEGILRLTKEIYEHAGTEFNINSPKQLGEILFDKMGLPPIKKTKTGYSTSADVLEKLAPQSDIVQLILNYRQLAKLQSTYVEGLLRVVRMPESRVHTSFRQAMTATGRLSSIEPNLQNIPIRMEEGRRLRQAFVPSVKDWQILSGDYSQIELRILAHLSEDEALIEAFMTDMDIHTKTASDVFEVDPKDVTSLMRRQAKAVNFGIIYGISDYGLAQNLNISRAQAGKFIEQYFAKFPRVKGYMDITVEQARERGYVETVLGRRRYLPQIRSRNFNERSFAERTAMNTPIQGTAADMIKLAMVNIHHVMKRDAWQSRMMLQVHDELIFEGPKEEMDRLKEMVKREMEEAVPLRVPVKVDLQSGNTWYDAK